MDIKFSDKELEGIADALDYLLDAELLPENGYTYDVVETLESTLKKVNDYLEQKGL